MISSKIMRVALTQKTNVGIQAIIIGPILDSTENGAQFPDDARSRIKGAAGISIANAASCIHSHMKRIAS